MISAASRPDPTTGATGATGAPGAFGTTDRGHEHTDRLLARYAGSLLPVFGVPQLVIDHGDGCYLVDVEGRRYLDLVGGLAVSTLGHNHPSLVEALAKQASQAVHVSNYYTTQAQIGLAERLLAVAEAPAGSAVFFCNSGTEAIEAAIKLSRRTGRSTIIAAEGSFHGRSTGALALTWKAAYREPFEPLLPGVVHVPFGDDAALEAAVAAAGSDLAAVVLEPIQGEGGVIPAPAQYLQLARRLTGSAGALLILDEIQTGIGRTGAWFAHQPIGIVPDAITVAKGLGGGVPIGALVTYGPEVTGLLSAGQHGSTFGGNPLACAAGLAILHAIESDRLLENVAAVGDHLVEAVTRLDHPLITGTRGRGLLQAILLGEPVAAQVAARALDAGFLVNAVAPDALRLAPPLVITAAQIDSFVSALPELLGPPR